MADFRKNSGQLGHESNLTLKQANIITGGLSAPSKMPGYAYNLPPSACITGKSLTNTKNSICHICYGRKFRYRWKHTINALYRRLEAISHPDWCKAMAFLILFKQRKNRKIRSENPDCNYFRHNDVGDLQSVNHLRKITEICVLTPSVKHWISTREVEFIEGYLTKFGRFPDNLTVRISANIIDQKPDIDLGLPIATVSTSGKNPIGSIRCPAKKYGNSCGPCRACWSRKVKWVDYIKH